LESLSRREIERIKKLADEIGVDRGLLLRLAEEDYQFGCQRLGFPIPKVGRKSALLFQCEMFQRAFLRRLRLTENYPKELLKVLSRIEEIIGWNFVKRVYSGESALAQPLLDALNDLVESFEFLAKRTVPKRIAYYAFRDPLTEVFNRHFLQEQLHFLSRNRENFPVGIIYLDLNNLKRVNDTYGHKVGDLYIQQFASILRSSVRKGDLVFRIGGDEFLIVVPKANERILNRILRRIVLNTESVNVERELPVPISFSAGWSLWSSPEEPFEEALDRADRMMYLNKFSG